MKNQKCEARINARAHFFSVRVILIWNRLPAALVQTYESNWTKPASSLSHGYEGKQKYFIDNRISSVEQLILSAALSRLWAAHAGNRDMAEVSTNVSGQSSLTA